MTKVSNVTIIVWRNLLLVASQKGENPRQPQAGYRVHSAVTSAREIEYCLYSAAMMLLGIIRHNVHVFGDAFLCHSHITG